LSLSLEVAASLVVSLVIIGIGLRLTRRGERGSTGQFFGGYLMLVGLWLALAAIWWTEFRPDASFWDRLPLYSMLVITFAQAAMTRQFLRLTLARWPYWVAGLMPGPILWLLDIFEPPLLLRLSGGQAPSILLTNLATASWIIIVSANVLLLIRNYSAIQHPLHRNRITYWAFVSTLAGLASAAYLANSTLLTGLLIAGSAALASYVVLTHRQPDIRLGSLRVFGYLLTTLVMIIFYAIVYWVTQFIVQALLQQPPYVAAIVNATVLAVLFWPIFTRIQTGFDTLLGRVDLDLNQMIKEYRLTISNILELDQLATVVLSLMSETMESTRGYLFLVSREGQTGNLLSYTLKAVFGSMGAVPPPFVMTAESPVASFLNNELLPLTQYDIDLLNRFQSAAPAEREWLSELGMDVYLPVHAKQRWIGLIALGPKASGVPYSDNDLSLLGLLAKETSTALENARLVEALVQLNNNLELKGSESGDDLAELVRIDRAKSDFVSIASHELRAPLTVIQGYTHMLKDDPAIRDSTYHAKLMDGIDTGMDRLNFIVESMIDVAKADNQDLQLSPIPLSVSGLIQSAADRLQHAAQERDLTFEIDSIEDLLMLDADREALQKVLFNLIANAIRYTPNGGSIQLTACKISAEQSDTESGIVEISVQDSGIGINPEDHERIFRKFGRIGELGLHSTARSRFMGAGPGLGLAIAKAIVIGHGGRIWVESPGRDQEKLPGSRFIVWLPLAAGDEYGDQDTPG
jgi:signal transduction histidine kinase